MGVKTRLEILGQRVSYWRCKDTDSYHLARDHHCIWGSGKFIHLLEADSVYFVVDIYGGAGYSAKGSTVGWTTNIDRECIFWSLVEWNGYPRSLSLLSRKRTNQDVNEIVGGNLKAV